MSRMKPGELWINLAIGSSALFAAGNFIATPLMWLYGPSAVFGFETLVWGLGFSAICWVQVGMRRDII